MVIASIVILLLLLIKLVFLEIILKVMKLLDPSKHNISCSRWTCPIPVRLE